MLNTHSQSSTRSVAYSPSTPRKSELVSPTKKTLNIKSAKRNSKKAKSKKAVKPSIVDDIEDNDDSEDELLSSADSDADISDEDTASMEEEDANDVELDDLEANDDGDPGIGPSSDLSDDPISLYLDEISRISLLSREKEVEIAKRIEAGNLAAEELEENDQLTDIEAQSYKAVVRDGDKARDELIEANYRLVISITKKYASRGVAFMDLIQEGNIGLIKAVDKFDYTRGYKFSTYATWWIRQAVTRAIADQGRTIRVPVHMCERINKLARTTRELSQKLGRQPETEEIAEVMETTTEGIQHIRRIAQHPLSLEMPIGEEQESNLGDFIEDDSSPTLSDSTTYEVLRELMDDVLGSLNAREGRVLRLRFGLIDGKPHTLEEVGQKFGVTRERVRQIEAAALRKLRHPRRSRKLKDFLE